MTDHAPRPDGLEEAIRRQREALDDARPRRDLWAGIAAGLDAAAEAGTRPSAEGPAPTARVRRLWPAALRVAAVLALCAAAGLWLTRAGDRPSAEGPATAQALPPGLPRSAAADPRLAELREVATRYERLVDRRGERILDNPALGPEESELAVAFLADLENDYRALLDDWAAGADPDKVLQAMVRNYRQRIELLEHLSRILEPEPAPATQDRYEDAVVL
jgi:hypothetical protein